MKISLVISACFTISVSATAFEPTVSPRVVKVPQQQFSCLHLYERRGKSWRRRVTKHTTVPEFWISETEVSVAEFDLFVSETGYKTTLEKNGEDTYGLEERDGGYSLAFGQYSWRNPGFKQSPDHPVVYVSYADCKAYCLWLSAATGQPYRLPTAAQWQAAFRFFRQHEYKEQDETANFRDFSLARAAPRLANADIKKPDDGYPFTAPVRSMANANDVFHLRGNVSEFCMMAFPEPELTKDKGVIALSGGSWLSGVAEYQSEYGQQQAVRTRDIRPCYGFRICTDSAREHDAVKGRKNQGAQLIDSHD